MRADFVEEDGCLGFILVFCRPEGCLKLFDNFRNWPFVLLLPGPERGSCLVRDVNRFLFYELEDWCGWDLNGYFDRFRLLFLVNRSCSKFRDWDRGGRWNLGRIVWR